MAEYKGGVVPVPYIEDGKAAVLVSGGYGAGWSTWNVKELAYDSRIVLWLMTNAGIDEDNRIYVPSEKMFSEYLESIGYVDVYMGGINDKFRMEWVDVNTIVEIVEHDGYESVWTHPIENTCFVV